MISVDFNELPAVSKNRFVAAGQNPASRIALYPTPSTTATGWGCLLVPSALLLPFIVIGAINQATARYSSGPNVAIVIPLLVFFVVLAGLGMARPKQEK